MAKPKQVKAESKKKKKTPEPEKPQSRLELLLNPKSDENKGLSKAHTGTVFRKASEDQKKGSHLYVSTGNYSLNTRLGGGLRTGCFHEFYGPEGSGKTFSVLKTIAAFQQSCSRCYEYQELCECAEGPREPVAMLILTEPWDRDWAESIGVDVDKLAMCRPACGEEGLDRVDVLMRTGNVDLICIDSLAFLTPSAEIEESVAKDHMGVGARMMSLAIRKIQAGIQKLARQDVMPTIVSTNQVRSDLKIKFGSAETTPQGQAPKFAATTRIRFGSPKLTKNEGSNRTSLSECRFAVKKNKQYEPGMKGEFRIIFVGGLTKKRGDLEDEHIMLSDARRYGIAEKDDNKWSILGKEFSNMPDILSALASDRRWKRELEKLLIRCWRV